ncbi:MAG: SGNH/GDSL hydrolase family protein [Planctomycetia bacterium]|nr:SGNH/GDSL hydrolase family protein [Planctomycetia bacterium]
MKLRVAFSLAALGVLCFPAAAQDKPKEKPDWVDAMRKVHAKFAGEKRTFAQFGDSITVTMAFWTPMLYEKPKNMDEAAAKDYELVKEHLHEKCFREWKGAKFGSEGGMTIRWAHENVDRWLDELKPEVALVMFGTNDLGQLEVDEYRQKTREVVEKCLDRGTVVILSTIPPRHGHDKKATQFADAVRQVARELKVPLCDYMAECLKRRPDDWDGTLAKFKDREGYDVLTLVAGDGVHPSNPKEFRSDFSAEGLGTSGYTLRNYVVLRSYAEVLREVIQAKP